MALSSMTGFARGHGVCATYAWAWEIKSVNGKGLDLRLRLPPGWDAIEVPVRAHAAELLARGSVQANLTVERSGVQPVVRVNAAILEAVQELPERERLVLSLYYEQELNLKEIGAVLKVTESRVCQLHGQALLRLKARLGEWHS